MDAASTSLRSKRSEERRLSRRSPTGEAGPLLNRDQLRFELRLGEPSNKASPEGKTATA